MRGRKGWVWPDGRAPGGPLLLSPFSPYKPALCQASGHKDEGDTVPAVEHASVSSLSLATLVTGDSACAWVGGFSSWALALSSLFGAFLRRLAGPPAL